MPGTASQAASRSTASRCKRRGAFLAALAGDVQDAVLAAGLEIPDLQPHQFADAATGIGQHRQHGRVTHSGRNHVPAVVRDHRGVEQAAAIVRRQADGFAVA